MDNHLLKNHCRFVTEDLDLSREVMGGLWEHHELRLNSGWKYGIRWHQVDLKHTNLDLHVQSHFGSCRSGPLSHTYRFGFHVDGTARYSDQRLRVDGDTRMRGSECAGSDAGCRHATPPRAML